MGRFFRIAAESILFRVGVMAIIAGLGLFFLGNSSQMPQRAELQQVTGNIIEASEFLLDDSVTNYNLTLNTTEGFQDPFTVQSTFIERAAFLALIKGKVTVSHKAGEIYAISHNGKVVFSFEDAAQKKEEGRQFMYRLGTYASGGGLLYLLFGFLFHGKELTGRALPDCSAEGEMLSPRQYIACCLTDKYKTFDGKAGRKEFWSFFIAFAVMMIAVRLLIYGLTNMTFLNGGIDHFLASMMKILAFVPLAVPLLAVSARRLQDLGQSKWWLSALVIYYTGIIFLLYFLKPSKKNVKV